MKTKIEQLDKVISSKWQEILSRPQVMNFTSSLMGEDQRAFALYMTQVYHYAYHNARNQALVAVNLANKDVQYMKFCLKHALEETGHELMALHDLRSIGVPINDPEKDMPPVLTATELLIAYLYWVSSHGNPVQRLGYSYWSEKSYDYIKDYVKLFSKNMGLKKTQLTFYFNHSNIDERHAKEVEDIIKKVFKTEDDWKQGAKVAITTLELTSQIFFSVIGEYEKLAKGLPSEFEILNCLNNNK